MMKIGILGTADIAFRRFLPALKKCKEFTYAGVASRTPEKAKPFVEAFGGQVYDGYDALLADDSIEAVYVPLPPALHYKWAYKALERGKHVFLEKPFTTSLPDTSELVGLATEKGLAIHENYMFQYHNQLKFIRELVNAGEIGELRLIRVDFGFPFRGENDFRYQKKMGGGALLDCGGYTVKLASMLLGEETQLMAAQLNYVEGLDVDIYGSATLKNAKGLTAQVSFGMDNSYRCELNLWGSLGTISTNRILTAPADYVPTITVYRNGDVLEHPLAPDDCVGKSINFFADIIYDEKRRQDSYREILHQASLVERFKEIANENY